MMAAVHAALKKSKISAGGWLIAAVVIATLVCHTSAYPSGWWWYQWEGVHWMCVG